MLVSVVIPFHNEADNLVVLLPGLSQALNACPYATEVLLIDDVSTDNSRAIAARHTDTDLRFRLFSLPARGGQTGAFRLGFAEARGDYIVRMDADLQDDPDDLPKFMEKMCEGYDLIMGIRKGRQHNWALRLLTTIYDAITSVVFQTELHSNSGSFIAFRTQFVKDIPFCPNDHRYLPLISMRRGAKNRCNVFLVHRPRLHGKTKYNILKKILLGVPEVTRFYFRYVSGYYDLPKSNG